MLIWFILVPINCKRLAMLDSNKTVLCGFLFPARTQKNFFSDLRLLAGMQKSFSKKPQIRLIAEENLPVK